MISNPDLIHQFEKFNDYYAWINTNEKKNIPVDVTLKKIDEKDTIITILGGKYKGYKATVCNFTKCKVYVSLIEENNRVVLLPKKSVFGNPLYNGYEDKETSRKEYEEDSKFAANFEKGKKVSIIRGRYIKNGGIIESTTQHMIYVKLMSNGETVRVMKASVAIILK